MGDSESVFPSAVTIWMSHKMENHLWYYEIACMGTTKWVWMRKRFRERMSLMG